MSSNDNSTTSPWIILIHQVNNSIQLLIKTIKDRQIIIRDCFIWAVVVAALVYKVIEVQARFGGILQCGDCLYLPVIQHDAIIFSALLLLYLLSNVVSRIPWAALFFKLLFAGIVLVYLLDIIIIHAFKTRLFLEDAQEFSGELRGGLTLFETWLGTLVGDNRLKLGLLVLAGLICLAIAIHFLLYSAKGKSRSSLYFLAGAVALGSFSFVPFDYSFVKAYAYRNVIEINLRKGFRKQYSDEYRLLLSKYREEQSCKSGLGLTPNIIIVEVESLSSYHSQLFSGINDYTPNLDRIARENTAMPNFYANGFRTTGGLLAMLTSNIPSTPVGGFVRASEGGTSYNGFSVEVSLPKIVKPYGYTSYFYASGDTNFSGQKQWLGSIGFDEIEDDKAAEFNGWPRFHFNSPPDEALYLKTLNKVSAAQLKQPYLLMLSTMSSHLPFKDPTGSGQNNEESVMRYVDKQLGYLYNELYISGFFDNGILIITGDHRAMLPVSNEETRKYGEAASAMIPLVIVWKHGNLPAVINDHFQQTDLLYSVQSVVSNDYCRPVYNGNFLAREPEPPRCVFHARGDDRDIIYTRCNHQQASIKLDGDNTRIIDGKLDNALATIKMINYHRVYF